MSHAIITGDDPCRQIGMVEVTQGNKHRTDTQLILETKKAIDSGSVPTRTDVTQGTDSHARYDLTHLVITTVDATTVITMADHSNSDRMTDRIRHIKTNSITKQMDDGITIPIKTDATSQKHKNHHVDIVDERIILLKSARLALTVAEWDISAANAEHLNAIS